MKERRALRSCAICSLTLALLPWVAGCAPVHAPALDTRSPSIRVVQIRPQPDDLPAAHVVDLETGSVFRVYHDSVAAPLAGWSLPGLAALYRELSELTAADPGEVLWSGVAFVHDSAYIPLRTGGEVRWSVQVDPSGELGPEGADDLYRLLPHEQVHAIQNTLRPGLPRWFMEGQASWAGHEATARRSPALAERWRNSVLGARDTLSIPPNLRGWGGVKVKREAILRQVTPEQRARMLEDPGYAPPGPFKLGPDDFVSDESHITARYGAALALFEHLESTAGRTKMLDWFRSVWNAEGRVGTEELVRSAQAVMGVNIAPWLK